MIHTPLTSATERMVIAPATLITIDATQDVRLTQAAFDAEAAVIEADMRARHGDAGASAARGITAAFQRMMVRL